MLQYAGHANCDADSEVTEILRQNTEEYLDKLAESFIKRTIPGAEPSIQINNQYNVYLQRIPGCEVNNHVIDFGDPLAPIITIENGTSSLGCGVDVIIKCFVFNDQIFNCDEEDFHKENQNKEIIILQITDVEAGEDLAVNFEVLVENVQSEECEKGCSAVKGAENSCNCDADSSIFDVGS